MNWSRRSQTADATIFFLVFLTVGVRELLGEFGHEVHRNASCFYSTQQQLSPTMPLPCAPAHYPPGLRPPRFIASGRLTLHLTDGPSSCSADQLPASSPGEDSSIFSREMQNNEAEEDVLVVRRGGCPFADKAWAAWQRGYDALLIVDYIAGGKTMAAGNSGNSDATTPHLVPPFLAGLEAMAASEGRDADDSPPTVVLVSGDTVLLAGLLGGGNGSSGAQSEVRVSVTWEEAWEGTDAATLYYDGMRLASEGKHATAAETFKRSAAAFAASASAVPRSPLEQSGRSNDSTMRATKGGSGFKAPGYERANALLRAGGTTAAIVSALQENHVLPDVAYPLASSAGTTSSSSSSSSSPNAIQTNDEPPSLLRPLATWREGRAWLIAEYAAQARRAHRRTFGFAHDDDESRRAREASRRWHVSAGMGLLSQVPEAAPPKRASRGTRFAKWLWSRRRSNDPPGVTSKTSEAASSNASRSEEEEEEEDATSAVVVVTVATDLGAELSSLAATVRAAGLDFKVLGLGRTYGTRGGTKLALMEEWLLSPEFTATYLRRNALVMFVDAYDVLLMPSAANGGLWRRFDAMGVDAVISGETGCWPDPGVAPLYPWPHYDRQPHFGDLYEPRVLPQTPRTTATLMTTGPHNTSSWGVEEAAMEAAAKDLEEKNRRVTAGTSKNSNVSGREEDEAEPDDGLGRGMPREVPFPYPNSGGYIAKASYMRRMIREVMDDVRSGHIAGGGTIGNADDQRWLQRHWLRHPRNVAIDTFAEIFLSLHRCCATAIDRSSYFSESTSVKGTARKPKSSSAASQDARAYHNHSITFGESPGSLRRQLKLGDWSWRGRPPNSEMTVIENSRAALSFNRSVPGGAHNASMYGEYRDPVDGQLYWGDIAPTAMASALTSAQDQGGPCRLARRWRRQCRHGRAEHLSTVWLGLGKNTGLAPIMVHGNGHGKRMLRILSCKMGLYCKWQEDTPNAPSFPLPATIIEAPAEDQGAPRPQSEL